MTGRIVKGIKRCVAFHRKPIT